MSSFPQVANTWHYRVVVCDKETLRYTLFHQDTALTFQEVIGLWQSSADFRDFYRETLADSAFEAFFWELPPVSLTSLDRAFEFVLVESTVLAKASADCRDFAEHFRHAREQIVAFQNLSRDAWLIVPVPPRAVGASYPDAMATECCAHLASFCRRADSLQQDQLWQQLGFMLGREVNSQPLWVSSCGLGVYWLHLRLDQRPKYYNYQPYKPYHG